MSLEQMATDLVEAAERYRRNNPQPDQQTDRIEDHLVIVHITHEETA